MKVCIIGWYGTETIGDRAILTGILALLSETYSSVDLLLGSLYPFFSERTVAEDHELWKELGGQNISVGIFDSTQAKALKKAIKASDLLLMGGGPLMDLREMHMVAFAFRYARSQKVVAGIFGCGIGPLKKPVFQKAATEILANADFAIFRDTMAEAVAKRLCPKMGSATFSAVDPAAYCAIRFKEKNKPPEQLDRIVINLRRMSREYENVGSQNRFEGFACEMVNKIMLDNEGFQIVLVPNHYFFFGGDDRLFMNTIKSRIGNRELVVQNRPLSLRETMQTFASSTCCVGMRFHSILLMGLLNGRCRILNYTGDTEGKIIGYLNDFDPNGFFRSGRMLSLESGSLELSIFDDMSRDERFEAPMDLLAGSFQTYRDVLAEFL